MSPAVSPRTQAGFTDPVHQSQRVFRAAMEALARPGRPVPLDGGLEPPQPLGRAAAALVLSLADYETPIWVDVTGARREAVTSYIRFHTGAPLTADRSDAAYAVITEAEALPDLSAFAVGTSDYPDRSTTLIVQVSGFLQSGWRLKGPGIDGATLFCFAPRPAALLQQLQANRSQFPLGVDLLLAGPASIAGLPRSTRIEEA